MKKVLKYIILGLLLLVALTMCSILALYIVGALLGNKFENILFEGFKVAFVASVILWVGTYWHSKR